MTPEPCAPIYIPIALSAEAANDCIVPVFIIVPVFNVEAPTAYIPVTLSPSDIVLVFVPKDVFPAVASTYIPIPEVTSATFIAAPLLIVEFFRYIPVPDPPDTFTLPAIDVAVLLSPYIPTELPPAADSTVIVPAFIKSVFLRYAPIIVPVPFRSIFDVEVRFTDETAVVLLSAYIPNASPLTPPATVLISF